MPKPSSIEKRARSMMKEERWLDAIKLLSDRSSRAGKHWKLSWNLGWCYFKLDKFDEARKHMSRADKLAPDNAICKGALGSVYLRSERYESYAAFLSGVGREPEAEAMIRKAKAARAVN
jgi:tetratricopeptide (TPR) repeat protein